jgi:hypothetical protein
MAALYETPIVLDLSKCRIMASNPTSGLDVCSRFTVFVLSFVDTGRFPVQIILQIWNIRTLVNEFSVRTGQ